MPLRIYEERCVIKMMASQRTRGRRLVEDGWMALCTITTLFLPLGIFNPDLLHTSCFFLLPTCYFWRKFLNPIHIQLKSSCTAEGTKTSFLCYRYSSKWFYQTSFPSCFTLCLLVLSPHPLWEECTLHNKCPIWGVISNQPTHQQSGPIQTRGEGI